MLLPSFLLSSYLICSSRLVDPIENWRTVEHPSFREGGRREGNSIEAKQARSRPTMPYTHIAKMEGKEGREKQNAKRRSLRP